MAEREEELKRFLMKVKEGSEKAGLKLNTQKIKIMASGQNGRHHCVCVSVCVCGGFIPSF